MRSLVQSASALVCCTGTGALEALALALEARVPFVGVTPIPLAASAAADLGERAWAAQVPIVLGAGAVPGIPGVLAEYLVRRLPEIAQLRVVTTGAWRGTDTARESVEAARRDRPAISGSVSGGSSSAPRRWSFPDPVGSWPVRPAYTADLEGFAEAHLVGSVAYLEVEPGPLARTALRLLRRDPEPHSFVAAAQALGPGNNRVWVEIAAPDVIQAAATAVGVVVAGLVARKIPAGLLPQREALNPNVFLEELQKRGLQVQVSPA
jgi:hypothetical protein